MGDTELQAVVGRVERIARELRLLRDDLGGWDGERPPEHQLTARLESVEADLLKVEGALRALR